jgi:hypothetical protein
MKSKYYLQALGIALIIQAGSCSKFVQVDPPKTAVISSEAFKSDQSATAAVTGIYAFLISASSSNIASGAATINCGMSADELTIFTPNATATQIQKNQITPDNSTITSIWNYTYQIIGQVNGCIDGLTKSTTLTPSVQTQLIGEAEVSRALLYFYLVNLYGDVPLVLTIDFNQTQLSSRVPVNQVYTQITTDLTDAANRLTTSYPTTGKVRPNKYVALALLARVYLYQKDYKNADAIATQVISSGLYNPLPNIDNAFLGNNTEAIWQLQPLTGLSYDVPEANTFIPTSSTRPPTYYLNTNLLNAFEPGDLRRTRWITSTVYLGTTYYYPFKYKVKVPVNNLSLTEYYTILRLSEMYLVRAEARANNNDIANAVADLNVIRARARDAATIAIPNPLPPLSTSLSQANTLLAVEQERRVELFAEWGHRWLDLKRTDRANTVLPPQKPTYTTTAQLFPIPQTERVKDINLTQNPGY